MLGMHTSKEVASLCIKQFLSFIMPLLGLHIHDVKFSLFLLNIELCILCVRPMLVNCGFYRISKSLLNATHREHPYVQAEWITKGIAPVVFKNQIEL